VRKLPSIATLLFSLLLPGFVAASILHEPEEDNREFMLDQETNYVSRDWRAIWDGSDNAFFFRLGSNNVREWFIEEKLKLALPLLEKRLRFLFYHARIDWFSGHRRSFDTMALEGRLTGRWHLALLATPRTQKKDDTIGFAITRRVARGRFASIYIEWPRFLNDFVEGHKQMADTLLEFYRRSPVRVGVDLRCDSLGPVSLALKGYRTNTFQMNAKRKGTEEPFLWGQMSYAAGWAEAALGEAVLGLRGGYESARYRRREGAAASGPGVGAVRTAGGSRRGAIYERTPGCSAGPWAAARSLDDAFYEAPDEAGALEQGASQEGEVYTREIGNGPVRDIEPKLWEGFGYGDLAVAPSAAENSVEEERVWWAAPYLTVSAGRRLSFFAEVLLAGRRLRWKDEVSSAAGTTGSQTNTSPQELHQVTSFYVAPVVSARFRLGRREGSLVEAGLAVEDHRRRETFRLVRLEETRRDHRLFFAYEHSFGARLKLRIVESLDLDRRDWGQFSIHDHGFFQALMSW